MLAGRYRPPSDFKFNGWDGSRGSCEKLFTGLSYSFWRFANHRPAFSSKANIPLASSKCQSLRAKKIVCEGARYKLGVRRGGSSKKVMGVEGTSLYSVGLRHCFGGLCNRPKIHGTTRYFRPREMHQELRGAPRHSAYGLCLQSLERQRGTPAASGPPLLNISSRDCPNAASGIYCIGPSGGR